MPYDLKGRNVLITGGSRGLGAVLTRTFAAQGCNIAINFQSSETAAKDLAQEIEEKYHVKATIIKADVGITTECERCVRDTVKAIGGLDILIGNAGYTKFTENWGDLDALSEEDWDKCFAVNVKSKLALMRAAGPIFRENPDGGVFLITSSIAGVSQGGSSMAYSVTKAAQLHLMKCLASVCGPKTRVNAVLPGLLLTDWGNQYGEERIASLKDRAALKKETDLQDCANVFVDLAKNTSITGAKIQVDAGLYIAAP
ncbi:Granaticin polyketide synthase putative ketoacyl reductase 2 [Lasiodiplodia hormozganensis]|uniref:Granaticin polyketide synthase putative ketoacyl reductase 2 n=1 Tax=Lasiodiplodia hormozganensis TaxID=869390 RepID=A0AA40CVU3_9PEZI|nr:Granaticin polyketide synthase putative ketoacyl reductase 2 [Lasiodiplodia hormozganensis]